MKSIKITIIAACCLSLTSCFTGIESTPRITAKEVQRNVPAVNEEADIASQLAPAGVQEWKRGRQFMVTDQKLSLLFEKEPKIVAGEILLFESLTAERSITGDTISVLTFTRKNQSGDNSTLRYKTGIEPESLSETFTLPLSVDLDMVADAGKKLTGKQFYIISPLRVDKNLVPTTSGRRYVTVTITDVQPGNADYPLRLDITDDLGNMSSVAMTAGKARSATRNFDKLFMVSNPRLRYPAITDTMWNNIINSRAVTGMTTEECRLALGAPRDIRKWHNGGSYFEGWNYDNGRYIIFEDGLLSVIR